MAKASSGADQSRALPARRRSSRRLLLERGVRADRRRASRAYPQLATAPCGRSGCAAAARRSRPSCRRWSPAAPRCCPHARGLTGTAGTTLPERRSRLAAAASHRAPLLLRPSLPIYGPEARTLRFHGAGAGVTVSSRVGAVLERRKREQKRSGGEGGGSANILVRGIKCSVAFASSFRFAITGSCFSTSIVALRPSNRRLQASENFSFVWCGRRLDASSRGFAINLGVWVSSLSPRERAQAGHSCPAYASRYPP